jgi:Short C-terminal domain/Domain of unknown function (DUF4429)
MYAKGHNGQVRIEGDWLIIERKGLGRIGHSKGDKRLALSQIVAVKMRPAGRIANGFIHFSTPGRDELKGGLNEATKDDNSVIFTRKQQTDFDTLRDHVENYIAARSSAPASAMAPDPAEQIRKFAQLRDEGILSEEEFQAKKAELLGI